MSPKEGNQQGLRASQQHCLNPSRMADWNSLPHRHDVLIDNVDLLVPRSDPGCASDTPFGSMPPWGSLGPILMSEAGFHVRLSRLS
jgi:hypothetical protein